MLGVPGRVPGRGDGAAAAGVPAPVPRRVHRPVAGRALDVPDLQVGHRPEHGRQPASSGLGKLSASAWGRRTALHVYWVVRCVVEMHYFCSINCLIAVQIYFS